MNKVRQILTAQSETVNNGFAHKHFVFTQKFRFYFVT